MIKKLLKSLLVPILFASTAMAQPWGQSLWYESSPTHIKPVTSGSIFANDGSSSAPGYTFHGDANTGLYRPSTDSMSFATAGQDRLYISNSSIDLRNDTILRIDKRSSTPSSNANYGIFYVLSSDNQAYYLDSGGTEYKLSNISLTDLADNFG